MKRKAIIISAPSGAGKTTIVRHLLSAMPVLEFSVSACSRDMREGETNGKDYYFLDAEDFRRRIALNEFVEWQEVYPGSFYGTLKSELERLWNTGKIPVFDVDVLGGLNLKKYFGDQALALFIQPPSTAILHQRLRDRGTENEESLQKRMQKAEYELGFSGSFDRIILNDDLPKAFSEAVTVITSFLAYGSSA